MDSRYIWTPLQGTAFEAILSHNPFLDDVRADAHIRSCDRNLRESLGPAPKDLFESEGPSTHLAWSLVVLAVLRHPLRQPDKPEKVMVGIEKLLQVL